VKLASRSEQKTQTHRDCDLLHHARHRHDVDNRIDDAINGQSEGQNVHVQRETTCQHKRDQCETGTSLCSPAIGCSAFRRQNSTPGTSTIIVKTTAYSRFRRSICAAANEEQQENAVSAPRGACVGWFQRESITRHRVFHFTLPIARLRISLRSLGLRV
jgi:hypothetical protein